MNRAAFTPPNVISPLVLFTVLVGSKDIPISWAVRRPWANALSVTVGTVAVTSGIRVPEPKSYVSRRFSA